MLKKNSYSFLCILSWSDIDVLDEAGLYGVVKTLHQEH